MDGPPAIRLRSAHALIGRDDELAHLVARWEVGGGVTLIEGPAGIGKSRLARELAAIASARGAAVLAGRCSATAASPLRPVREALLGAARSGLRPPEGLASFVPALARLVPDWAAGSLAGADPSNLVLAEALLRLLGAIARPSAPALLVVDDLQWADAASIAVVDYLADNIAGTAATVVLTARTGDAPSSGGSAVRSMVERRAADPLVLGPLRPDDVARLVRAIAGADLPAAVDVAVRERSDGVPFLVEELLAATQSTDGVLPVSAVPGSVASAVAVRLDRLPPDARRLLERAAALGRSFDWTVAARAVGLDDRRAADLLRAAVLAQLVDVDGTGFRFHHALTRDAVMSLAGPAEMRVAAQDALAALEAGGSELDAEDCELAASLAVMAGDPARADDLLLDAADRALADGSLGVADALAGRVQRRSSADRPLRADLLLLRVAALSGRPDHAAPLGARLLRELSDPEHRAEVLLLMARAALAGGVWSTAEANATAAQELVPGQPVWSARAASIAALAAMARDDDAAALRLATAALADGRATGQPEVQCEALEVIGRAHRGRDLRKAEAAFEEALQVASDAGLVVWRVRALQELGTVDLFESLAIDRLLAARRAAEEIGALSLAAVVDLQLAAAHDERGEIDETLAAARRCEAMSRRWGLATLPMSLTIQAMAHARHGDEAAMHAAAAAARATGQDQASVEIGLWGNVYAVWHLAMGDLPSAAAAFDRGMALLRELPGAAYPFAGLGALVHAVLDDDGGVEARAAVHRLPVDTPVSRAMARAADAVAAGRSPEGRAAAMIEFTEADEALARFHGGFRRAMVRLVAAPRAHVDGWGEPESWLRGALATFEQARLSAFSARAREALRGIGAPVPRRGRGHAAPVPPSLAALGVTSRELEVLSHLGAGLTNKQIAERLVISPRTVDKHVERLLMKAQTDRRGLADLAVDAGLAVEP